MSLFKKNKDLKRIDNPTDEPGYYTDEDKIYYKGEAIEEEPEKKFGFGMGLFIGAASMFIVVCIVGAILFSSYMKQFTVQTSTDVSEITLSGYEAKINIITAYLDAYYLNDYNKEDVENGISKGMLSSIGDKYAQYYTAEEFTDLKEKVSGSYSGIGVGISQNENGEIVVYKIYEGTPAEDAGLWVNDIIVEANGVRDFETTDDLVAIVRGETGTTVDIVVLRDGEELSFTIERKDIALPTVYSEMLDDNIGYIYISEFDVVTTEQFNNALDDLESQGMEAVILDLRDNPGGDYDTVVTMADRVLPEGPIITTMDKNDNVKTEYSDEAHQLEVPCVVIVNGNSASAAELFTGALQDYEIATVVGQTTYGKGVVQSIFALSDGSGMKFTTSKYYTPNGRDIDGVGIVPDVVVEIPESAYEDGVVDEEEDTQLQKAIEILKNKKGE